ncbi:MAG: translation initiation factor IF-2 [Patescibacteria group bacterium]
MTPKTKSQNEIVRSPIVVVMGHVDHGKTALLDYIRKTNVVLREPGGITQSIGAYEIEHNGKKITFLDTPGHEAFSKMRARGASVADIAVLVIAADEGVKPQTKDALKHIEESKTPFIVALNKIDKPGVNIEKVKSELGQAGIYLEGSGGNVSFQAISAKTGEGVQDLLDLILLSAEVQDQKFSKDAPASGIILTVQVDSRKGIVVGGIVKNGILKKGEIVFTPSASGKIKSLKNFIGVEVEEIEPSAPAMILGFENAPEVGEKFSVNQGDIEEIVAKFRTSNDVRERTGKKLVNVILKANEGGTLDALEHVVGNLSKEISIIDKGIGDINENNIKLAITTNSIIVGFKVKADKAALNLAQAKNIRMILSDIVYDLEKELEKDMLEIINKEDKVLEILAAFGKLKGKKQVVGGKIIKGPIKNQEKFRVSVDDAVVGEGKILNLQAGKQDVSQAESGEVGLSVETTVEIKPGAKLLF